MGLFDNATSVVFNNKEVISMKIGDDILYEKVSNNGGNSGSSANTPSDSLIINFTGSQFSTNSSPFTFSGDSLTVDWGDGSELWEYRSGQCGNIYSTSGNYTITITGEITKINKSCLNGKTGITSVVIPIGVTTIGWMAFNNCTNLASITFSNTVTSIEGSSFYGCSNLTSITFKSTTPPTVAEGVFDSVPTNCTIYVPSGSLSAYTSAANYPDPDDYSYVEY